MRHRIRWVFTIGEFDVELSGEGEIEGGNVRVFDPCILIADRTNEMYIEMGLETFIEIADVVRGWVEKLVKPEAKA